MIGLLNESDWKIQKREPYQKYKDYEYVINQALESVQTIGERLNDKELLKDKPKGAIYLSSNHFFEASLELIVFSSVHDKFHRTLILSGFCLLKIAKISLNSSFFPKPIKR